MQTRTREHLTQKKKTIERLNANKNDRKIEHKQEHANKNDEKIDGKKKKKFIVNVTRTTLRNIYGKTFCISKN